MALLYRVGSSRLRPVSQLLYTRLTAVSPSVCGADLSNAPAVHGAPSLAFVQLRSFAAPVQSNKHKVKSSEDGPRINNAITGQVVRLVGDEGHCVVSLREALDRARRLDLDLVEVQRTANPPVCKIMDFNKEKYKKELTERERSKTKSALSKRSGEKKEVRFKAKTELKDLKVKADGITRLMERGYRVKCTALPSGSQEEELGEHLSRLLKLIEEVSIIESGPHVDAKQAYAIVRHIKFDTKKSKKSNKISDNNNNNNSTKSKSPAIEEESEWECESDSDESTKVKQVPKVSLTESKSKSKSEQAGSVKEEIKNEQNRYAKKEPENNSRVNNNRDSFNQGQVPINNNNNSREFNGRVQFDNNNNSYGSARQFQPGNFGPNIPNRNLGNPNFSEQRGNLPPFQSPNFGPNSPNRNAGSPNFSEQRSNSPPFSSQNFVPNVPNRNPNFSQERSNLPPLNFVPNIPNRNPNFSQERSNLPASNFVPSIPNRNPNFSQERSNLPPSNFVPNIPNRNPNFSQERSSSPPFNPPKFVPNRNPNFSQERSNLPPFQAPKFVPNMPFGNPPNPNFSQERSTLPYQSPNFGQFRKEAPLNPNSSQNNFANPNVSQERSSANEPPKPKFGLFNSSMKSSELSDSSSQTPKFGVFSTKRTDFSNN